MAVSLMKESSKAMVHLERASSRGKLPTATWSHVAGLHWAHYGSC